MIEVKGRKFGAGDNVEIKRAPGAPSLMLSFLPSLSVGRKEEQEQGEMLADLLAELLPARTFASFYRRLEEKWSWVGDA